MKPIIIGGGIAGLSLAYFLKKNSIVLEKEKTPGGLCRSFEFNKISYDVGPHTMFPGKEGVMKLLISSAKTNKIKRSNKIYHKGRLIKYPFESDLASLDDRDREYCLKEFLHNPYKNSRAQNMLQFFLKTFGQGITKLHLQPYNQKVWKISPDQLDIRLAERIPKPLKEDIIKSAQGIETERHAPEFDCYYPDRGGIQETTNGLLKIIADKSRIVCSIKIKRIYRENGIWQVATNKGNFSSRLLVNCMPLHELFKYLKAPQYILKALHGLKYNSIYIVPVQAKKDNIGNNLALYFADKDIIFNRISKLDFLGSNYRLKNHHSTVLAEITYRPKSYLSKLKSKEVRQRVIAGLDKLNLVKKEDVVDVALRSFEYAYVVYDLNYKKNVDCILKYLLSIGIYCCGRFAEFEYLNIDGVVEHSDKLAKKLNEKNNL